MKSVSSCRPLRPRPLLGTQVQIYRANAAIWVSPGELASLCTPDAMCMPVQLRSVTEEARVNLEAVVAQRDDAVKKNADLKRRHAHFQHEIRRKEQDYERLQVQPDVFTC